MAGTENYSNDQKIQRVLPLLLRLEKNKNDYFPEAVSFGPYHHGKSELAFVEAFKPKAVELFVSDSPGNKELYYNKVVDDIGEIRNCYEEASVGSYSDEYLAGMMLHDACLIIIYMEILALDMTQQQPDDSTANKFFAMMEQLGMLALEVLSRDLILLENQIPLRVIELLMNQRYGAGRYEDLLSRYLNVAIFGEYRQKRVFSKPLHLLEAIHMLVVSDCAEPEKTRRCWKCTWLCCFKAEDEQSTGAPAAVAPTCCSCTLLCCPSVKKEMSADLETGAPPVPTTNANRGLIRRLLKPFTGKNKRAAKSKENIKKFIHSFRSVSDLKAKGIYFKPSPTESLKDVKFKSYLFYGRLQLPEWGVSTKTKVIFVNLIAYELSPNSPAQGEVASYISFMKSLIERPEDVKELRDKKIFYNTLGSDEEVFNVFKEINTHGANNPMLFRPVKDKIQAHYNSRIKTWTAELIHSNFRSPWTIIAFFAAVALLGISAGQLYYAVRPN